MKFPFPSGDILTVHCDLRLAHECYMASLRPQLSIQQTNHIERLPGSGIALSSDNLDPRVGRDVRLEPVEETTPWSFQMATLSTLTHIPVIIKFPWPHPT